MNIEITAEFEINSSHEVGAGEREFFFRWKQTASKEIPVFCDAATRIQETEHWQTDESFFELVRSTIFSICSDEKSRFICISHNPILQSLFPSKYYQHNFAGFVSLIDDNDDLIEKLYVEGKMDCKKSNSKVTHFSLVVHDGKYPYSVKHRASWKHNSK